jgi:hypothetical protein
MTIQLILRFKANITLVVSVATMLPMLPMLNMLPVPLQQRLTLALTGQTFDSLSKEGH